MRLATVISSESLEKSLPGITSMAPLMRLTIDHLLGPDMCRDVCSEFDSVERLRRLVDVGIQ
jgi:hypothetical protein